MLRRQLLSKMAKAYTQERLTSELKGFLGTRELVSTLQHEAWRLFYVEVKGLAKVCGSLGVRPGQ
jgi:hypothetical protein